MGIKLRGTSRLNFSRFMEIDGVEFWEMPEYPDILAANDDVIYQTMQTDRIDKIANKFYGNPELWWVIAIANDLNLLPNDLVPRGTIRIPSNQRVKSILNTAPKRRSGV